MTVLSLENLGKHYPSGSRAALEGLSLSVERGEIFALLGESGSGKTTTLRLIAGFEVPSQGRIQVLSRTVADPAVFLPPEKRKVAMVFQQNALFPHLTVEGNLRFALDSAGVRDRERIGRTLATVGLADYRKRYPHELSGGQRQRAELARALVSEPALLLLDEPFSNLDPSAKGRLRLEVAQILRRTGATSILVTHDVEDAFMVSDRVAVLHEGRLEQVGAPREIYLHPANSYVARLFGAVNLLEGRPVPEGIRTAFGTLPSPGGAADNGRLLVCLRPECLEPAAPEAGPLSGRIERLSFLGRCQEVHLAPDGEEAARLVVHLPADLPLREGGRLDVRPRPGSVRLLAG